MCMSKFKRYVCPYRLVRAGVAGVQRNSVTIKRPGLTVNIFPGTGTCIMFGKDFDLMRDSFKKLAADVVHMQEYQHVTVTYPISR